MQTSINIHTKNASVRFTRYNRKAYAVFASLDKNVTIGTLASYIANRQMCKSGVSIHTNTESSNAHSSENDELSCIAEENTKPFLGSIANNSFATMLCAQFTTTPAPLATTTTSYKNLINSESAHLMSRFAVFIYPNNKQINN